MVNKKTYAFGILTLLIVSASLFTIFFKQDLKIDLKKTSTVFSVNESGEFIVAGTEYGYLFYNKTKIKSTKQTLFKDLPKEGQRFNLQRVSEYENGAMIIDTYFFDGAIDDVTKFPLKHEIRIINATGLRFDYVVKDLSGPKDNPNIKETSMSFDHKMKVEWQPAFTQANYKKGVLTISYLIKSSDFTINARLFDPPTLNISFYGNASNGQNYEYQTNILYNISSNQTIANITINGTRIDYNQFINVSATTKQINISVDDIYEDRINGANYTQVVSNNGIISWNLSDWYEMKNLSFNLRTSIQGARDVSIFAGPTLKKILYGYLYNDSTSSRLETYNFTTGSNASAFFAVSSELKSIFITIPTTPLQNITFNITGSASNPISFDEKYFVIRNGVDIENTTSIANQSGTIPLVVDNFQSDRGKFTTTGNLDFNNYNSTEKRFNAVADLATGTNFVTCGLSTKSGYTGYNEINLNEYDMIGINHTCTLFSDIQSGSGSKTAVAECDIYASTKADGTGTNYLLQGQNIQDGSISGGVFASGGFNNTYLIRSTRNSTTWNITTGNYPGTYLGQIVLPDTNLSFVIYNYAQAGGSSCTNAKSASSFSQINQIVLGGFGGEDKGSQLYGKNFSFTSKLIFNTTQNISGATITAKEYTGNTTLLYNFSYYLSANNGTTWESATNGVFHKFIVSGTNLKYKIEGNSPTNASNFGVASVTVQVTNTSPSNITINLGADTIVEYNYSAALNMTVNVKMTDSNGSIATYILENCLAQDYCVVPIQISSGTPGEVKFSDLTTISALPNIVISNLTNNGSLRIVSSNITNFTVVDYRLKYAGDLDNLNLTTTARYADGSTLQGTISFNARFSPFNLTTAKPFLNFFPKARIQANVTPDGQKYNIPFWNITTRSQNHTTNIYMGPWNNLNGTCLTLWAGNQTTKQLNITSAGGQLFKGNFSGNFGVWNYLDFNNCTRGYEIDVVFNSLCSNCILTNDYDEYDGSVTP